MKPCPFCQIISGETPSAVFYRNSFSVAFLDKRPLFPGHTLLAPLKHIPTMEELLPQETGPLFETVRLLTMAIKRATGSEGTFVAVNNTVSQSVPHLHIHIVPRRKGDGLRGFFWPRTKYGSEEEMKEMGRKIGEEMRLLGPDRSDLIQS